MHFYAKGDFKIEDSWQLRPSSRKEKSQDMSKQRGRQSNPSLVNAGKNSLEPSADLLDQQTAKYVLREFQAQIPPSCKSAKKISDKQSQHSRRLPPKQKQLQEKDNDLLSSLAARLKTVEMTCKNQREEIKEKNSLIDKLKAENQFLKGTRDDSGKEYSKMEVMKDENQLLLKKIGEMEAYLKKYGLKWVGNQLEGSLDHQQMKKDIKKPVYNYKLPSQIDIGTIMRRVEELNAGLHSEGFGTEIYEDHGIHKFRQAKPLPMGFFSNGIAIKGYTFYPYKSNESLHILSDLVEGYFPYVLKSKFPNGVMLQVLDKIADTYTNTSSDEFITTFESQAEKELKPPSKEQFLNKLPKQIVYKGKMIEIRGAIEKRLNGQADVIKEVEEQNDIYEVSDGIIIFKTEAYSQKQTGGDEKDICVLKVRKETGEVLILHLREKHTIQDVYSWIGKAVKGFFKLMSNFPRRTYQRNQSGNLSDLGLFPNALLHIQSQNVPK